MSLLFFVTTQGFQNQMTASQLALSWRIMVTSKNDGRKRLTYNECNWSNRSHGMTEKKAGLTGASSCVGWINLFEGLKSRSSWIWNGTSASSKRRPILEAWRLGSLEPQVVGGGRGRGWINPFEGLKFHKGRLSTKALGHWKDLELRRGCHPFCRGPNSSHRRLKICSNGQTISNERCAHQRRLNKFDLYLVWVISTTHCKDLVAKHFTSKKWI